MRTAAPAHGSTGRHVSYLVAHDGSWQQAGFSVDHSALQDQCPAQHGVLVDCDAAANVGVADDCAAPNIAAAPYHTRLHL